MTTKAKGFEILDEDFRFELLNRFINFIDIKENECWEWIGARNNEGYGIFKYKNKNVRAHRFSYALFKDQVPEDLLICHKCDNPSCCNPYHLELGTNHYNQVDCFLKNRGGKRSKLNTSDVIQIKKLLRMEVKPSTIAFMYDITESEVSRIKNNKRWSYVVI